MVLDPQGSGRVDRRQHWFLVFLILQLVSLVGANAGELMSSADHMNVSKFGFSFYGLHSESEPVIKISGNDAITVPTTGGDSTIFSQSNAEIEMEQSFDAAVANVVFRPGEGLYYRAKLGQVRDFQLQYSSGTQVNDLEAFKDGLMWGVGVGANITPGSLVSSAISWELSYTRTTADLERFKAGSITESADARVEQDELQGSLTISRRFKRVEPYGGVKVIRRITELKDFSTKEKVKGTVDDVSPFVGVQFALADKEHFIIEGSFVGEEMISTGFLIYFGD